MKYFFVFAAFIFSFGLSTVASALPVRAGINHVAGHYSFYGDGRTPAISENYLVEGAERAYELGTDSIVILLKQTDLNRYPDKVNPWPAVTNLTRLIKTKPYQKVLNMKFNTYVIWTFTVSNDDGFPGWTTTNTAAKEQAERDEIKDLALYLMRAFRGTGKVFILKNWETDNVGLTTSNVQFARNWFIARQNGVNDARAAAAEAGYNDVYVYHAVEVNKVFKLSENPLPTIRAIRDIVPYVNADMLAYSAYDSTTEGPNDPDIIKSQLATSFGIIDSYTPDPLALGSRRVFISEYGTPDNSSYAGVPYAGTRNNRTTAILSKASDLGLSYAFTWGLFDNECTGTNGLYGLGLSPSATPPTGAVRPPNDTVCPGWGLVKPNSTITYASDLSTMQGYFASRTNCTNTFSGTHDIVGIPGDNRFLCYANRWYDCNWEGNAPSWETKAADKQRVGSFTCSIANSSWIPVAIDPIANSDLSTCQFAQLWNGSVRALGVSGNVNCPTPGIPYTQAITILAGTRGDANGAAITTQAARSWQYENGNLAKIAAGYDGAVWGINSSQLIFRFVGGTWENVQGTLTQIAVGADGDVWGINANNSLFHYVGGSAIWQQMSGSYTQVSVGAANAVWAINTNGQIFRYSGSAMQQVTGALSQIAVGADGDVWGINSSNTLYHYVGGSTIWQAMSGTYTKAVVGSAFSAWSLDTAGSVFRYK